MARKPKITKLLISKAAELARAGFSHKQIQEAVDISHTAFYGNVELLAAIKREESELRTKVSDALMSKAVDTSDTTALIFLAKRLNLFNSNVNIQIKDSKTALEGLSKLIDADIPLEQKNSTKGIIESYLKGVETVELEERIAKLEESKNEKS